MILTYVHHVKNIIISKKVNVKLNHVAQNMHYIVINVFYVLNKMENGFIMNLLVKIIVYIILVLIVLKLHNYIFLN